MGAGCSIMKRIARARTVGPVMRERLKTLSNSTLRRTGMRLVNAQRGPRGYWESLRRVQSHDVVPRTIVDVGAANGTWTAECLALFPKAKYLLVDPLEENRPHLDQLRESHPNVTVWSGALGAAPGKLYTHVHGDQSSFLASEYAGNNNAAATTAEIDVRTLDSFVDAGQIAPPDLIKADVQGYELEVLRGAERCLRTAELLLLEVSFRRVYSGCPLAHEVISYCGERGFRIYDVCSYTQRPRDGELVQSDILFARSDSKLFA